MKSDEKKARQKKIHLNTDVERAPRFKANMVREEPSKGDVMKTQRNIIQVSRTRTQGVSIPRKISYHNQLRDHKPSSCS